MLVTFTVAAGTAPVRVGDGAVDGAVELGISRQNTDKQKD
jgi:hypothetical protein